MDRDSATRWGIPNWTNGEEYPDHTCAMMTKAVWRWEFLRRRKDYRDAWDHWRCKAGVRVLLWKVGDPYVVANTDDQAPAENFDVDHLYDPSQRNGLEEGRIWKPPG